jgi:bifunctional pyridoxal-dependent enzyme with beta-cystathionase and maltose regulon repressor activities
MVININQNTSIQEIIDAFKSRFPGLKIEFFIDENHDNKAAAKEMIKNRQNKLSNFVTTAIKVNFEIHGNETISEFENKFKNTFGLMVQVFHKRSNVWILTTNTDYYTLDNLNSKSLSEAEPMLDSEIIDAADRNDLE